MPRSEERGPERESTSRRSRSGRRYRGRSRRSRSRNHHRHQHGNPKHREKNFLAAACNMIAIVILCSSLAAPKWITFSGGRCRIGSKPLTYLGVNRFFYPGSFIKSDSFVDEEKVLKMYQFGPRDIDRMDDCVTEKAVLLMKTMIAFIFISIFSSLTAFVLDLMGPSHRILKLLRRNAMLTIITVVLTVVVDLFCYWLTTEVSTLQKEAPLHKGSKIYMDFDTSFYLVTAAGCVSVLATALNCLKRYPHYETSQGEPLLNDYDDALLGPDPAAILRYARPPSPSVTVTPEVSASSALPPPPAYTP